MAPGGPVPERGGSQAGCVPAGTQPAVGALLWVAPRAAVLRAFVLYPLGQSIQYSFYNWDGIGTATPAGLANWPGHLHPAGAAQRHSRTPSSSSSSTPCSRSARAWRRQPHPGAEPGPFQHDLADDPVIPQGAPARGRGRRVTWLYSSNGLVNQILRATGLGGTTRLARLTSPSRCPPSG